MRITRFSDIGLRVLIYLAGADKHRSLVTVSEISKQFDIPLNHLVKVAGHLAREGWIQALRGRKGGLVLIADPKLLRIGGVLRNLEGENELVDCAAQRCQLSQNCLLRGALAAALRAFYDEMDKYVLADMSAGTVGQQIILMHQAFLKAPYPVEIASL